MPCENLDGWEWRERGREAQEGENICTHTVHSLPCTAETNIIKQLYSNKKKFLGAIMVIQFCRERSL